MAAFWLKANVSIQQLFDKIQLVRTGQRCLADYLRLSEDQRPSFLDLTESQIAQRYGLNGIGAAPSAFALKPSGDGARSEVALDLSLPLGLLLPIFMHELVHVTDSTYRKEMTKVFFEWERFHQRRAQIIEEKKFSEKVLAELTLNLERIRKREAQILLAAEKRAYTLQLKWINEVCEQFVGYDSFLKSAEEKGYHLRYLPNADQLNHYVVSMQESA